MKNTVLIVGNGGREHALLKAVLRSGRDITAFAYPGSCGMERDGCISVKADITNWNDLATWAKENGVDLAIIGPELPLTEGIVDIFLGAGIPSFGPSKLAAQLEGSKHFSKEIMKKYGIPTAEYETVTNRLEAEEYLEKVGGAPIVIKVSGLAGGKGAIVCETQADVDAAIEEIYGKGSFGEAADQVVIEEMMYGEEASIFVVTDGEGYKILPAAQDHKRIFDNDKGPNTGGMGAYTPAPVVTDEILSRVEKEIIKPTLSAMINEGMRYQGLLYVGIMLTDKGPRVVEYNCRFGDPETEAVLPMVDCDWYQLFRASALGGIENIDWSIRSGFTSTIVLASAGYPATSDKGRVITGVEVADAIENVDVYHAGTALNAKGELITNGGRVLAVTAFGETLQASIELAYTAVSNIKYEGLQFRTDIGKKGLARF